MLEIELASFEARGGDWGLEAREGMNGQKPGQRRRLESRNPRLFEEAGRVLPSIISIHLPSRGAPEGSSQFLGMQTINALLIIYCYGFIFSKVPPQPSSKYVLAESGQLLRKMVHRSAHQHQ